MLLIAPLILSKEIYGSFEFYKKIIELGAAGLTFGLPTLILTYPKSPDSKIYFTLFGILFIITLGLIFAPFLNIIGYLILLVPIYFHSIFFNIGVIPPFILTLKGSNKASIYKIGISILFYTAILLLIYKSARPELAYVTAGYILLPLFLLFTVIYYVRLKIDFGKLKRYWSLFKKLILSSLTIVVSNFANMMFLYTDILIIKLLSQNENVEIADYSFSLNITNALILVPLTLVQVDIEKLKSKITYLYRLNFKIRLLTFGLSILLLLIFLGLTSVYFEEYRSTLYIFLLILVAKIFQALSVSYGAHIIIGKYYLENLKINLTALIFNVMLSFLLYDLYGLLGVASASIFSLLLRYILLIRTSSKIQSKKSKA